MKLTRPALRYFGGKWRLAPWIIEHFPPHGCYVEPFCGAASVFLRKAPAEFEVINDVDGDVVNFFQVLRDETDSLIHAVFVTPYSRAEYKLAWEPAEDSLERARRYYVRNQQGWSGGKSSRPSAWRYQHSNNRGKSVIKDWNDIDRLSAIVWRLKQAFPVLGYRTSVSKTTMHSPLSTATTGLTLSFTWTHRIWRIPEANAGGPMPISARSMLITIADCSINCRQSGEWQSSVVTRRTCTMSD